ncbi:MAG: DUF1826 domain-containing protein [Nitrosomonas sp.]|nr:DUF1826 domain-containing protein [Nitrosomonas sp.]MCW5607544.1 DUF1826 domain-containing protein [Nitrosomonas sp.]
MFALRSSRQIGLRLCALNTAMHLCFHTSKVPCRLITSSSEKGVGSAMVRLTNRRFLKHAMQNQYTTILFSDWMRVILVCLRAIYGRKK